MHFKSDNNIQTEWKKNTNIIAHGVWASVKTRQYGVKILYILVFLSALALEFGRSSSISQRTLANLALLAFDPGFYKRSTQHPLSVLHTLG